MIPSRPRDSLRRQAMMGQRNHDQGQLFYSFCLDEAVPDNHPVRQIAAVLDLTWVHAELAPYCPKMGRPSIDPVLMIRMLVIGYHLRSARSERYAAMCRLIWPIGGSAASALRTKSRTIRHSRVHGMSGLATATYSAVSSSVSSKPVSQLGWLAAKDLQSMPA
jgi:hypothetical protein